MYYFLILISVALIIAINGVFLLGSVNLSLIEIAVWCVVSTIAVIVIDGFFAFIVRRVMPEELYSINKTHFVAKKKKRLFYEKLGVKRWKDKVLELGIFTGFSKSKVLEPKNSEYIKRFIIECNYGVGVHLADMIMGFIVVFINPKSIWLSVGLPVAFVNLVLNYMPYVVLRYNLYKLHKLHELNLRLDSKKNRSK
jgi:hypothetical protein